MRIIKLQSTKYEMNVLGAVGCGVYFSNCSSAAQGVGEADVERDLDC